MDDRIDPYRDLLEVLLAVEKPGRYTGGEYGVFPGLRELPGREELVIALGYPDLYELGMSNLAVRLLYNLFNGLEGIRCERFFAPAPDFEMALKEKDIPLYTLESGIPLGKCDLVCFSVGYELTLSNVLTVLDTAEIPLERSERGEGDPLILAGGPGVTNPAPLERFLDFVYLGEGEAEYQQLLSRLQGIKAQQGGRQALQHMMEKEPYLWYPGRKDPVRRVFANSFGSRPMEGTLLPIPSIKTVQDHGVVEIMRGCPNGCRFCHAGFYYRPWRAKDPDAILQETDRLVFECGYREITLSSLSSADYEGIHSLISQLNSRYPGRHISFSLPSLRINSFNLPLLEELSRERRSGLTFAVESGLEEGRRRINKEVDGERIREVLEEARNRGWKTAKFYFMVGIPGLDGDDEVRGIIDYMEELQDKVPIHYHVNLATYIPKPYTPFERVQQISEEEGLSRIQRIRRVLKKRGMKVSYHSPFLSVLEGVFARGDRRAGDILLAAWKKGARMDAWDDQVRWDLWREVIQQADWPVISDTLRERGEGEWLPWDTIRLGTSPSYLRKERQAGERGEISDPCGDPCPHPCGVCSKEDDFPRMPSSLDENCDKMASDKKVSWPEPLGEEKRLLLEWEKQGRAVFLSHLDMALVFSRALPRAGIPVLYSQGKNPKPRIEMAQPLSLGMTSRGELAGIMVLSAPGDTAVNLAERLNASLPEGVSVRRAAFVPQWDTAVKGKKTPSLMSLYGGSRYRWFPSDPSGTWHKVIRRWDEDRGEGEVPLLEGQEGDSLILHRLSRQQRGKGGIRKILETLANRPLEPKELGGLQRTVILADIDKAEYGQKDYFEYFGVEASWVNSGNPDPP